MALTSSSEVIAMPNFGAMTPTSPTHRGGRGMDSRPSVVLQGDALPSEGLGAMRTMLSRGEEAVLIELHDSLQANWKAHTHPPHFLPMEISTANLVILARCQFQIMAEAEGLWILEEHGITSGTSPHSRSKGGPGFWSRLVGRMGRGGNKMNTTRERSKSIGAMLGTSDVDPVFIPIIHAASRIPAPIRTLLSTHCAQITRLHVVGPGSDRMDQPVWHLDLSFFPSLHILELHRVRIGMLHGVDDIVSILLNDVEIGSAMSTSRCFRCLRAVELHNCNLSPPLLAFLATHAVTVRRLVVKDVLSVPATRSFSQWPRMRGHRADPKQMLSWGVLTTVRFEGVFFDSQLVVADERSPDASRGGAPPRSSTSSPTSPTYRGAAGLPGQLLDKSWERLSMLTTLSLHGCGLRWVRQISALSRCHTLRVLDLSANRFESLDGLELVTSLITELNASRCFIANTRGIRGLEFLETLSLRTNCISKWADVTLLALQCPVLTTIALAANPIVTQVTGRDVVPLVKCIFAERQGLVVDRIKTSSVRSIGGVEYQRKFAHLFTQGDGFGAANGSLDSTEESGGEPRNSKQKRRGVSENVLGGRLSHKSDLAPRVASERPRGTGEEIIVQRRSNSVMSDDEGRKRKKRIVVVKKKKVARDVVIDHETPADAQRKALLLRASQLGLATSLEEPRPSLSKHHPPTTAVSPSGIPLLSDPKSMKARHGDNWLLEANEQGSKQWDASMLGRGNLEIPEQVIPLKQPRTPSAPPTTPPMSSVANVHTPSSMLGVPQQVGGGGVSRTMSATSATSSQRSYQTTDSMRRIPELSSRPPPFASAIVAKDSAGTSVTALEVPEIPLDLKKDVSRSAHTVRSTTALPGHSPNIVSVTPFKSSGHSEPIHLSTPLPHSQAVVRSFLDSIATPAPNNFQSPVASDDHSSPANDAANPPPPPSVPTSSDSTPSRTLNDHNTAAMSPPQQIIHITPMVDRRTQPSTLNNLSSPTGTVLSQDSYSTMASTVKPSVAPVIISASPQRAPPPNRRNTTSARVQPTQSPNPPSRPPTTLFCELVDSLCGMEWIQSIDGSTARLYPSGCAYMLSGISNENAIMWGVDEVVPDMGEEGMSGESGGGAGEVNEGKLISGVLGVHKSAVEVYLHDAHDTKHTSKNRFLGDKVLVRVIEVHVGEVRHVRLEVGETRVCSPSFDPILLCSANGGIASLFRQVPAHSVHFPSDDRAPLSECFLDTEGCSEEAIAEMDLAFLSRDILGSTKPTVLGGFVVDSGPHAAILIQFLKAQLRSCTGRLCESGVVQAWPRMLEDTIKTADGSLHTEPTDQHLLERIRSSTFAAQQTLARSCGSSNEDGFRNVAACSSGFADVLISGEEVSVVTAYDALSSHIVQGERILLCGYANCPVDPDTHNVAACVSEHATAEESVLVAVSERHLCILRDRNFRMTSATATLFQHVIIKTAEKEAAACGALSLPNVGSPVPKGRTLFSKRGSAIASSRRSDLSKVDAVTTSSGSVFSARRFVSHSTLSSAQPESKRYSGRFSIATFLGGGDKGEDDAIKFSDTRPILPSELDSKHLFPIHTIVPLSDIRGPIAVSFTLDCLRITYTDSSSQAPVLDDGTMAEVTSQLKLFFRCGDVALAILRELVKLDVLTTICPSPYPLSVVPTSMVFCVNLYMRKRGAPFIPDTQPARDGPSEDTTPSAIEGHFAPTQICYPLRNISEQLTPVSLLVSATELIITEFRPDLLLRTHDEQVPTSAPATPTPSARALDFPSSTVFTPDSSGGGPTVLDTIELRNVHGLLVSSSPLSPLLMGLEVQNPSHGNRDTIIFAAQHTQVMSTLFAELKRMCFNLTVSELTVLKYTAPSNSFVSEDALQRQGSYRYAGGGGTLGSEGEEGAKGGWFK